MKNKSLKLILKSFMLLYVFIFAGCNDEVTSRNDEFPKLNPINIDIEAGNWKTYLLSAPDEFSIEVPYATNTASYTREINEIKSFQLNITADQKKSIQYWSVGSVLRWNEILRTLVARHNRPPYQNEDGTYPAPSAANPFAYPQFPFSNPPYAARAYAYVSAAQYDALVAAWHYKKAFNRAAPYTGAALLKAFL